MGELRTIDEAEVAAWEEEATGEPWAREAAEAAEEQEAEATEDQPPARPLRASTPRGGSWTRARLRRVGLEDLVVRAVLLDPVGLGRVLLPQRLSVHGGVVGGHGSRRAAASVALQQRAGTASVRCEYGEVGVGRSSQPDSQQTCAVKSASAFRQSSSANEPPIAM